MKRKGWSLGTSVCVSENYIRWKTPYEKLDSHHDPLESGTSSGSHQGGREFGLVFFVPYIKKI